MNDTPTLQAIHLLADILQCPPDSLSSADSIETVEKWDSLNHMRLVLLIEETYQIKLEPEATLHLFTIGGIADLLKDLKS